MEELISPAFSIDQQAQNIRNASYEKESKDNISVAVIHVKPSEC